MSNSSAAPNQQVSQIFFQLMAKHGVAVVKNAYGRVGSLAVRDDGAVVHFGLQTMWVRPQDREKIWLAAKLPGAPGRVTGDDVLFFQELMRALAALGLERIVWSDSTQVMFIPDASAPSGLAFRMRDLNCIPRGENEIGLHL